MGANMFISEGQLRDVAGGGVLSAVSGLVVGGTAGGSDVFAMRNVAQAGTPGNLTRAVGVSSVRCAVLGGVTAYAAAASVAIAFYKATGFTVFASSGTTVAAQRRTLAADAIPQTEISGHVATTGAFTAGTRSLAAQPFFVASFGGGVTFGGDAVWVPEDGLPIMLQGDEGIVAQLLEATPATGTARLFFAVDFFRFGA